MDANAVTQMIEILDCHHQMGYPVLEDEPELVAISMQDHFKMFSRFSVLELMKEIKIWQDAKRA
jgi:hypothetical protein